MLFNISLFRQLHHHHGGKASGLGTQAALAQVDRDKACLGGLAHLVDGEVALRAYQYGRGGGDRSEGFCNSSKR